MALRPQEAAIDNQEADNETTASATTEHCGGAIDLFVVRCVGW
ncbi:hypothetical protein [Paraburkholderia phenoliruptrix]